MLDLAEKYGKGPISLKDVAERQEISEKYLWHLIRPLKNAELVHSTRGAHGGYVLARSPENINLKDIVSVLEGPMNIVECTNDPGLCKRSNDCTARQVWAEVSQKIMTIIESYTLEHMLKIQKSKRSALDYAI